MLPNKRQCRRVYVVGMVLGIASRFAGEMVRADVFNMGPGLTSLEFVTVGDPGNPSEPCIGLDGWSNGDCGAVGYSYAIGKYEITVAQYTKFLNAVAVDDTNALYHPSMAANLNIAGIERAGSPGSYSYSVVGSPNHPIAYIDWGDAARFANWLTNGQPMGSQNSVTTEDGSYSLDVALLAVSRKPGARFVIPTEDEWYKAAYYDPTPGAGGGDNYWKYPVQTDVEPFSDQPPGSDSPNAARAGNFRKDDVIMNGYNDGYAVTGSPTLMTTQNYLTDVGAYSSAESYYGTFDQGGNVVEWNETIGRANTERGTLGGSWDGAANGLESHRDGAPPTHSVRELGFRIACTAECCANDDCDDHDPCTHDACAGGFCFNTDVMFGDVNNDGEVDIFDILCVLDGFAGTFNPPCTFSNVNLAPCEPDEVIDIFDILAVLDAFSGVNVCNCPAGP